MKSDSFSFPDNLEISDRAKRLVRRILHPLPNSRPTIEQILQDDWFLGQGLALLQRSNCPKLIEQHMRVSEEPLIHSPPRSPLRKPDVSVLEKRLELIKLTVDTGYLQATAFETDTGHSPRHSMPSQQIHDERGDVCQFQTSDRPKDRPKTIFGLEALWRGTMSSSDGGGGTGNGHSGSQDEVGTINPGSVTDTSGRVHRAWMCLPLSPLKLLRSLRQDQSTRLSVL